MLPQEVFIWQPASLGGGQYSFDLYFNSGNFPKYTALGDIIEDSGGNRYKLIAPTIPPAISDGATLTVEYIDSDSLPIQDSDFDSLIYTPGQKDYSSEIYTGGTIFNPTIYDSTTYEYQVEASWDSSGEAGKASVGDYIVDATGKLFVITSLTTFASPFRVKEVDKEGVLPTSGTGALFRQTSNYAMYQGVPISDSVRTVVRNRDNSVIDDSIVNRIQPFNYTGTGIHPKGSVVRKASATEIGLADNTSSTNSSVVGILLEEIYEGKPTDVQKIGYIKPGVITSDRFTEGSLPADNTRVWLSSTPGKMTVTPPVELSQNFQVIMGIWNNGGLDLQIMLLGRA